VKTPEVFKVNCKFVFDNFLLPDGEDKTITRAETVSEASDP
jgi:hypothetical protein